MNPVAKKCVGWAIGLFVVGTALMAYLPNLVTAYFAEVWNSPSGSAVFSVVTLLLSIVREAAMPTAAALIGAAVVINTLRPGRSPAQD